MTQENRGLFLMLPDCLLDDTELTETAIIGFARLMRHCQQQRIPAFTGSLRKLSRIIKISKTTTERLIPAWIGKGLVSWEDEEKTSLHLNIDELWQRNTAYIPQEEKPRQRTWKDEIEVIQRHLRKARQLELPATLTIDEWLKTLTYFNWRCAYCLVGRYHVLEHFIPMREGGGTTHDNVVPSCRKCNRRKYSFLPEQVLSVEVCNRLYAYFENEVQA